MNKKINDRVHAMLIGRVMKLAFVAVLAVALGVGATLGGAHLSAGTLQATLSAASESGECSPCEDCAKPCVASIMCGTACISLGLTPNPQGIALNADLGRLAPNPDPQLSSAELGTPTPPPRLIRFV